VDPALGGTDQPAAIVGEPDSRNRSRVIPETQVLLAGACVPDPHAEIVADNPAAASAGDAMAIGREADAFDEVPVAIQIGQFVSRSGIPDLHAALGGE